METILGLLAMACVPAYWVLQVRMARSATGGWRIAALLPLFAMVPLLGFTAFAFASGANLWPLLLILASPVAVGYLAVLAFVRIVTARG